MYGVIGTCSSQVWRNFPFFLLSNFEDFLYRNQFLYTTCSPHVLSLKFSRIELLTNIYLYIWDIVPTRFLDLLAPLYFVRVGGTLWHWYWYSSQFHLTWYILFFLNSNLNRDTFFSKFKHESYLFCGTLISDSVMLLYWIR